MIYSALVDADFQETETYMKGAKPRGGHDDIPTLRDKLDAYLKRFENPTSDINRKRNEILQACIKRGKTEKPGFFSLTVPTGGGKTLASMAFALHHAAAHGLKRVIYVIPFTTIIEQNAKVFKDILGEEPVLEHHSNFDWEGKKQDNPDDRTNSALAKLKLAAENWDIPIVVTTNVQFFESLFANKSSRCRKAAQHCQERDYLRRSSNAAARVHAPDDGGSLGTGGQLRRERSLLHGHLAAGWNASCLKKPKSKNLRPIRRSCSTFTSAWK